MADHLAAAKAAKYMGLFETPVIVSQVPDVAFLTGELRGVITERRANHDSAVRSNKGGWQSDTAMLDWGGEPARELGALMLQMCSQFTRDVGQTDTGKPRFEWSGEMWANICPRGGSHESHTHPGSLWSAVFFLDNGLGENEDDSKVGYLVLQDPRNPLPVIGLLSQANYSDAEVALSAFVEQNPSDPLAGNAKYWLGETYYVRGDYQQAAVTFAEAYQEYPDNTKAPDNLLKLGLALGALGNKSDACGTLSELLKRYQNAAVTLIQRAKQEQTRLGCS